ncbi:hypothetical protein GE09DRAFT_705400 [Coniochaeta sp. 2T2.1]|nr:hypothetical protein GE09DRAFT_705400 [Coniochaeta sp. 2T2.1]
MSKTVLDCRKRSSLPLRTNPRRRCGSFAGRTTGVCFNLYGALGVMGQGSLQRYHWRTTTRTSRPVRWSGRESGLRPTSGVRLPPDVLGDTANWTSRMASNGERRRETDLRFGVSEWTYTVDSRVLAMVSNGKAASYSLWLHNSPFSPFVLIAVATHTVALSLFSRTQRTPLEGRLLFGFGGVRRFGCSSGIGRLRRFICTSCSKSMKLQLGQPFISKIRQ